MIINNDEEKDKEGLEDGQSQLLSLFNDDIVRLVGLYGEVNEENCKELITSLYALSSIKKGDPEDPEKETCEPIEMIVSTEGGHVVDMLQFPLIEWTWPSWLPYIGGKDYLFFQYIFTYFTENMYILTHIIGIL